MNTKILFSSNKHDWTTPKDFFDLLNKEFNFTLDPCCYPETVFCNPPYGRETKKWVVKAYEESRKENTKVVMLIPARPDVSYFHDYIQPYALEIRFVRGRLKFGNSKNAAPFPSMVVIF